MDLAGPPEGFAELTFYSRHFMDLAIWEPFVRLVASRHEYEVWKISSGLPGTYPTFIAEINGPAGQPRLKAIVVKFFGPLFDGSAAFQVERSLGNFLAQHSLSIASPVVLADGRLSKAWSYIIFNHIAGVSYGEARHSLPRNAIEEMAQQIGCFMKELHGVTASRQPGMALDRSTWRQFAEFLDRQRAACVQNHRLWSDLPPSMLEQLPGFILPVDQLLDLSSAPHFIHADLTGDHLLGRVLPAGQAVSGLSELPTGGPVVPVELEPAPASAWENLAIIDWGDSRVGNILYELVALHMDLFEGDKELLHLCLAAYELPGFYVHDFAHKALSMVLLHQFPMPAKIYARFPSARDLFELADDLFSL